jgi:hypothetical protein
MQGFSFITLILKIMSTFLFLLSNIQWMWFAIAVVVTFIVGAIWYSFLFPKTWMRVFKVEMPEEVTKLSMVRTMLLQLIVSIFFGAVFFLLVQISFCISVFVLIGFCGWEKGELNFQFPKWKDYVLAACIRVGYTFVAGMIFIIFGLISR